MMDSRVGFGATSILEDLLREYISTYTINKRFVGDLHYLGVYEQIVLYNSGGYYEEER